MDGVSDLLHCHIFDTREVLDGKPPLTLNPVYDEVSDILQVDFVYSVPPTKFMKTISESIEVGIDNAGKIVSLLFFKAKNTIAKPLSEEERENLAKKSEACAKELENWSCSI